MIKKKYVTYILIFITSHCFSQSFEFSRQWQNLGPESDPYTPTKNSNVGIGPIEFVRVTHLKEGLLLAGSLSGGLFYTENGGEDWINAGSDYWPYSQAAWADFHPEDHNTWFVYMHERPNKGKPGRIGEKGGVYRTDNKGTTWRNIGDLAQFNNNSSFVIYGTRFHPENSNLLYVLSNDGLYYSENCLADSVVWKKNDKTNGLIYDMVFIDKTMYFSCNFNNNWAIFQLDEENNLKELKIDNSNAISHITLKTLKNDLLILIDFNSISDQLMVYNFERKTFAEITKNIQVSFGHGYTFAVNPHNFNEVYVGSSLRLKKYIIDEGIFENISSDYHVDVEFVSFDPFDTNKVWIAHHGGVSVSLDKGKSWESRSNGLGVAEVLGLDVSETDPNQIVIGTYHDGSIVRADWDKNGNYYWRYVNGGDALIPLINPLKNREVYTSNQYVGGGIYYSSDTAKNNLNIHDKNNLRTSGWEMAANLHPIHKNLLFFNFKRSQTISKDNIDIARTYDASKENSAEIISDFKQTHQLENYKVYGLFNSQYHPNILIAYVISFEKDKNNNPYINHLIFKNNNILDSAGKVVSTWIKLETPNNDWIGDVEIDKKNPNKIYISYIGGRIAPYEDPSQTGMIFYAKYNKKNTMTRNVDISKNIPSEMAGKYNLIYIHNENKCMFIATRYGVFYSQCNFLKGWSNWEMVGYGLPHCRINGFHFHEKEQLLTVGLKGRGIWRLHIGKK